MGTIKALDGNAAIAYGVMRSKVQLVAAYPITPQTPIVETISSLIDTKQYDATYITVESEHSALSAVIGAASTGVRTFTASASHGLALMHEVTGVTSASRLPVVMAVVSRAIPGPMCLWCDHSDIMTQRDQGWIQLFAQSPQEALDMTMIAYRTSEDARVLIPTMVDIDGFFCSHLTEPVNVPTVEEAEQFIQEFKPVNAWLDTDRPYAIDNLTSPAIFTEIKKSQDLGMRAAAGVLDLNKLETMEYGQAMKYLTGFYGIGKKVANCVCLFGLHHIEAFPVDTWIEKILLREYFSAKKYRRTPKNRLYDTILADHFGRYGGYAGVLQQYIFYYERLNQHKISP